MSLVVLSRGVPLRWAREGRRCHGAGGLGAVRYLIGYLHFRRLALASQHTTGSRGGLSRDARLVGVPHVRHCSSRQGGRTTTPSVTDAVGAGGLGERPLAASWLPLYRRWWHKQCRGWGRVDTGVSVFGGRPPRPPLAPAAPSRLAPNVRRSRSSVAHSRPRPRVLLLPPCNPTQRASPNQAWGSQPPPVGHRGDAVRRSGTMLAHSCDPPLSLPPPCPTPPPPLCLCPLIALGETAMGTGIGGGRGGGGVM